MKCPVCGGSGIRVGCYDTASYEQIKYCEGCGNCHGTGETATDSDCIPESNRIDIIEGCGGVVKGYKEDKDDA